MCTLYISWINWIWQQNQDSKCTCAIHPTQDIYMTGIEYKIWKMLAWMKHSLGNDGNISQYK